MDSQFGIKIRSLRETNELYLRQVAVAENQIRDREPTIKSRNK